MLRLCFIYNSLVLIDQRHRAFSSSPLSHIPRGTIVTSYLQYLAQDFLALLSCLALRFNFQHQCLYAFFFHIAVLKVALIQILILNQFLLQTVCFLSGSFFLPCMPTSFPGGDHVAVFIKFANQLTLCFGLVSGSVVISFRFINIRDVYPGVVIVDDCRVSKLLSVSMT